MRALIFTSPAKMKICRLKCVNSWVQIDVPMTWPQRLKQANLSTQALNLSQCLASPRPSLSREALDNEKDMRAFIIKGRRQDRDVLSMESDTRS